ncbi:MAG: heme-binding protein [Pseudomonadota bacterium]
MSVLNKLIHLSLAGALAVAGVSVASEVNTYKGYETPPYRTVSSSGDFEVREYEPHILAEVAVSGDRSGAVGRGFRVLADYIFGGNVLTQKIAMTSPVSQVAVPQIQVDDDDPQVWRVQFMMPGEYQLETLPEPDNASIQFVRTEPERQVVLGFSGLWTDASLRKKTDQLRAFATSEGLEITGEPRYYFYDDPFTLPFNRRNEVAFTLN